MLLEELAKKETLNVDFHNHVQQGSLPEKEATTLRDKIRSFFLGKRFFTLLELFDKVRKSNLDILYVTNTNFTYSYEEWTSEEQLEKAREAGYKVERGEYFTFFEKDGVVKALGKSHEIFTTRGHVLFSGIRTGKRFSVKKSLEATLAEADDKELRGADHAFVKLRGQNGILATSKNLAEDAKKIDYVEINGNFYPPFSFNTPKVIKFAKEYDKPILSNSDEHSVRGVGKGAYNTFNSRNLDYTSERAFRDSINECVRNKKFTYTYKPNSPWRVLHHGLMIFINYILNRIGRKEGIEISAVRNKDGTYSQDVSIRGDYSWLDIERQKEIVKNMAETFGGYSALRVSVI